MAQPLAVRLSEKRDALASVVSEHGDENDRGLAVGRNADAVDAQLGRAVGPTQEAVPALLAGAALIVAGRRAVARDIKDRRVLGVAERASNTARGRLRHRTDRLRGLSEHAGFFDELEKLARRRQRHLLAG